MGDVPLPLGAVHVRSTCPVTVPATPASTRGADGAVAAAAVVGLRAVVSISASGRITRKKIRLIVDIAPAVLCVVAPEGKRSFQTRLGPYTRTCTVGLGLSIASGYKNQRDAVSLPSVTPEGQGTWI